jgi:hypothetical protein
MTAAIPHPRSILGAIAAGVVAGVTMLICLVTLDGAVLHTPGFGLAGLFAFDAAVLVGRAAGDGSAFVALGIVLHFAVSIVWALGYAVVAERRRQLLTRPILSGTAFGVLVYFCMQVLIITANRYRIPTPLGTAADLVAHAGFFGIPVALIVARTHRSR